MLINAIQISSNMAIMRNPYMSPDKAITCIDIILNHLKTLNRWVDIDNVNSCLEIKGIELPGNEIENALLKLVKDGFAEIDDDDNFRITFEGILFEGYEDKLKKEHISNRNKSVQTILLIGGTLAAGLYGIFEVLKWLFHHMH
jgi:hypothetical protein